ncbi:MAG: Na+/H+ antiporter [Alphaproteobacteria bacterium]|nr:Na+/H+ antiporter [Alphaproteobacteria bacterium]
MNTWPVLLLLLGIAVVLAWGARLVRIPIPVALVIGGLGIAFVPNLPIIEIDPHLILVLVLPPLLFRAAVFTPWRDFWAHIRPISMLAIGLVVATTGVVAVAAEALIPGLGWGAAFVLGAIISPPDAVASTAVFSRLRLNRRVVTIVEGESLVNDATGLVIYKFAVAAVVTGSFSFGGATLEFLIVAAGGIAMGVVLGYLFILVNRRIDDPLIEIALSILFSYAVYLAAEYAHVSGVLAVVAAGLVRGWHAPEVFTAQTRIQAAAVWDTLDFLLNGFVFILIGLELKKVFIGLTGYGWWELLGYGLAITAVAIVVRIAWVFPGAYLPRLLSARVRAREAPPGWRSLTIVGWCGMRGIVSLAAALALPYATEAENAFPGRDLVIFLTFVVIMVTLVFQGLTLAPLIRWLGVGETAQLVEEEHLARLKIAYAAIEEIDRKALAESVRPDVIDSVRGEYAARLKQERLVGVTAGGLDDTTRALRLAAVTAERRRLLKLHRERQIGDEVLRRIQHELDIEELRLEPSGER